jgi:hypothetical protein
MVRCAARGAASRPVHVLEDAEFAGMQALR